MLTDFMRQWGRGIVNPIARAATWAGVTPDSVTFGGFVMTVVVGYLLSRGYVQVAGGMLIVASFFDAIDGAMARMGNRATRFGAFLDSTLDRFSEAATFLGILIYFHGQGATTQIVLTYLALVGSLMVSYTRARAEGLGVPIRGGFLTRAERVVLLIIFLLLNQLSLALWVLAPLTILTVLQRVWIMRRATWDDRRPD
jgi:CDP-diacylglycerol--glycerol-3-phosphate 3-phosphatidyltransferase